MADETTRRPKKKTPARSTSSRTAKASASPARSKPATRTTSSSSRTTTKAKASPATSASPKKSSATTAKPKKAGTTRTKKKSTLVTGDAAPRPKAKSAPRPSGARSKSADKAVQKGPGKPTGKSLTIRKTTPASSVARAVKAAKAPSVTGLVEMPKKTKKKKVEKTVVSTPTEVRRESARQLATWVAVAGMEKKADRIEVIDLHEKADYADFLVLMSGRSDRQVQSIATGVDEAMRERGHRSQGMEGLSQGHWVLVDFGDVIVHVFLEEARKYYDIESLWMDAGRVPFEGVLLPPPKPKANPDEGPSTLP